MKSEEIRTFNESQGFDLIDYLKNNNQLIVLGKPGHYERFLKQWDRVSTVLDEGVCNHAGTTFLRNHIGETIEIPLVTKNDSLFFILDHDFSKINPVSWFDLRGFLIIRESENSKLARPFFLKEDQIEEFVWGYINFLETTAKTKEFRELCLNMMYFNPPNTKRKPSISKSIRHEVFKRDDYTCLECGATKDDARLHIDHILPVSQGGTDELVNLQVLCEACNLAKSGRKWKGGC